MPVRTDTTEDLYLRLEALTKTLSEESARTVDMLQGQAISYVWGWQDAGKDDRDSGLAYQFGLAYGLHAAEYAAELRCWRGPIQLAWQQFQRGEDISAPL